MILNKKVRTAKLYISTKATILYKDHPYPSLRKKLWFFES
jgi:hypothetical protein